MFGALDVKQHGEGGGKNSFSLKENVEVVAVRSAAALMMSGGQVSDVFNHSQKAKPVL